MVFIMRVTDHWHRLHGNAEESSRLEILKSDLGKVLASWL